MSAVNANAPECPQTSVDPPMSSRGPSVVLSSSVPLVSSVVVTDTEEEGAHKVYVRGVVAELSCSGLR